MAARKKNQTKQETPEREQTGTQPEQEAPEQEQTGTQPEDQEPERDEFENIPNPCVYCGPSVRGVAR